MAIENLQKMKWPSMAMLATLCFVLWLPDLMLGLVNTHFTLILLTLLLTVVNGLCLMTLVYDLNISMTRSFLTLFSYVFPCSCIATLHIAAHLQLEVFCFILILFALHSGWRQHNTAELGLRCGLLCVAGTYCTPHFIYVLPWLIICFMLQESFSFRTLLAIVLGYACYFLPLALPIAFPGHTFSVLTERVLLPFTNSSQFLLRWQDFLLWRTHLHLYVLIGLALLLFFFFLILNTTNRNAIPRQTRFNILLMGFFLLALADFNAPIAIATFAVIFSQTIHQANQDSHRGYYFTIFVLVLLAYYWHHLTI